MDTEPTKRPARVWWFVVAIVVAGGLITWLAFGVGLQKQPVDVTNGVELVVPTERTGTQR